MSIPKEMNALVASAYGEPSSVVEYKTFPSPTLTPTSLLVKIEAASVNPADWKCMLGWAKFVVSVKFPHIFGVDFAGIVVAKADKVTEWNIGDEVYGRVADPPTLGCHAEYALVETKTSWIAKKPSNVTWPEAGSMGMAAVIAYDSLVTYGKVSLNPTENSSLKVLVIGASGGIGTITGQIGKALGIGEMWAVCSGSNEDFVKQNGYHFVVDYTKGPLTEQLQDKKSYFDIVIDLVGGDEYYTQLAALVLQPSKLFVTAVGPYPHGGKITIGKLFGFGGTVLKHKLFGKHKYGLVMQGNKGEKFLAEMLEKGLIKPPIQECVKLSEGVKAYEISMGKKVKGKLVITP